jgi:dolichol kinase
MAVPPPAPAFADAVYAWLVQLDPATLEVDGIPEAKSALEGVHELAAALSDWYGANPTRNGTEARTESAFQGVVAALPQPGTVGATRLDWLTVREQVSPMYEAFALALKSAGGRARHLHPTNYLRSFVHLMNGLAVVAAFQFVFTPTTAFWTATAFVVWAWSLEGARRVSPTVNAWCMKVFGPIARDHERYRVNSATWYGTALWVLAVTAFGPAGVLGLLCLAVGDPVAGLIGRTYGQIRIPGGKSLEGSLAFALVSTAVGYTYLLLFQWTLAPLHILLSIAIIAGVCGALIELVSTRLEDNFTIPVFTSWLVQLALWLLT